MEIRYSRRTISSLIMGLFAILAIGYFVFLPRAPGVLVSPSNELTVTASEFKFDLSADTVKSGLITITVKNVGAVPHELTIYKITDAEKVRTMHTEEMVERAHEEESMMETGMMETGGLIIAEVEEDELPVGATKTIQATLAPGVYELGCFVPGHYEAGMKAALTVV